MPGFDGTGPAGMGPRTGGGRGFCPPGAGQYYGYGTWPLRGAGRGGIPWGGGRGRAWGGGRGRRWYGLAGYNFYAAPPYGAYEPYAEPSIDQEMEFLRNQSSFLEQELEQIRRRLDELSSSKDEAK